MLEDPNNVVEDGVNSEENKFSNMGATRNMTASRITVLQERKKQIEETLNKRNQELRQLCIQEAELTGITPPEMPLEPGETLPLIRRRVGTSYQLPEKLFKNGCNKDEMIADFELQIELHANMAEAALGLANEHNMSKTMKRQHRSEYQKHKQKCLALQEKVAALKEKAEQQKQQKKKPRTPETIDDTISVSTNGKQDPRHSISLKHNLPSEGGVELRYHPDASRSYRMSEVPYLGQTNKPDDILTSGFYRLSLNGYHTYMERRENINNVYPSNCIPQHSPYPYNSSQMPISNQHLQNNLSYQQSSPLSQHSPLLSHSPHLSQQSPHSSQHSPHYVSQKAQYSPQQRLLQHPQYTSELNHRQSSPTAPISPKSHYYPSYPTFNRQSYRYDSEVMYRNHHQIQPHQQYEQMNVVTSGLGGYWKRTTNGELVWYSSSVIDGNWQRDKRFGSLDRRKTKRLTSRISPNIDNKSATLSTVPNYQGQVRSASIKSSQILNRRSQDNGQLVRTQSLGSVGAITVDSVYPTDDSSSYGSDSRSLECNQTLKKHKEKEWLESSLDGPVMTIGGPISPHRATSPQGSVSVPTPQPPLSSSQPTIPTFSSEEKVPKEIPAESNPSTKSREPHIELFNNTIPKNCTIVQAGHCKPYHEETKPFEMSDFYKYSTKFKKSPTKSENEKVHVVGTSQQNLNKKFDESKGSYSPSFQQHSAGTSTSLDNSVNLNTSLNLDQLAVSEHFSDEMNAWYKEQRQNNNNAGTNPKNRSTATLV
ncbi:unnamed protein product [Psylliodes chrysocephalus]|uniref:Cytohesin Ubiquitin Protein Inducing domain-containing protein n=1 Tax=Psylliodes chrysocephalus TaxID=3402493 RepID=A0A9P0CPF0_9CUCU|nr:unnamed protein product [Psylliodes chrysocephala]